eukprot:GHVT01043712.1.p2 GENE.GHVT01043712.1~~GHVT01043712.1.p2  ORF type:complete len:121 (+),score=1.82 GHVT01043712.1:274-636(+)
MWNFPSLAPSQASAAVRKSIPKRPSPTTSATVIFEEAMETGPIWTSARNVPVAVIVSPLAVVKWSVLCSNSVSGKYFLNISAFIIVIAAPVSTVNIRNTSFTYTGANHPFMELILAGMWR